jgi:hypothetical protein
VVGDVVVGDVVVGDVVVGDVVVGDVVVQRRLVLLLVVARISPQPLTWGQ